MSDNKYVLSQNVRDKIDQWLLRYPPEKKRSGVLQALHYAQEENNNYLTEAVMDAVADYLNLPDVFVYEVATFYTMYHLEPVGNHVISVCTNISCMLNGAEHIVEHLKKRLQIQFNETTADKKFTLKEVECLAACIAAPVCQIGKKYYENLTPEKIDKILQELN